MLTSLHIENIAVIKRADLEFDSGFTVLTGETGAGKSIIIDSINLLLGNRTNRDLIRSGENTAAAEAIFSSFSPAQTEQLTEFGFPPDEEGCILLRRTLSADGKSQARLNGRIITLSALKEIAHLLITIHGQHDNQRLLQPSNHIGYLDRYARDEAALNAYTAQYETVRRIQKEISSIARDEREKNRLVEMDQYQIREIDAAHLKIGEEEELNTKRNTLRNIEKISKSAKLVYRALYDNEKGVAVCPLIDKATEALEKISDVLPSAPAYIEKLNGFRYEIEDIALSVSEVLSGEYENPDELRDAVETRLEQITKLEKKYGPTVSDVLAFRDHLKEELDQIETAQERLSELTSQLDSETAILREKAAALTELRKKAAAALESAITDELRFLDMKNVSFAVAVTPLGGSGDSFCRIGQDDVAFLISPNPGEPLKPLADIASGGELSRVTLALKSVLNEQDAAQTLIFDEIDTGVSGSTSQKIGIKLKQISDGIQVVCVTHSAQIAALAAHHVFVSKHETDGRTETDLTVLTREERIRELARIMGGRDITPTLLKSAGELLELSEKL